MTSQFVSHLTQFPPKRYASCASRNSIYQVQDIISVMAAITAETDRLSKTLIDHGYVMSEFGGIDEAMRILPDLSVKRRAIQEEAARREALVEAKLQEEAKQREALAEAKLREEARQKEAEVEARHQEALKVEGEAAARARRELREAREAMDEMVAKVKSLEELHQANLESKANLAVELKELKDFRDQALKKAKKDELLTPVSCKHCIKRFDDGVYMAWQSNGQSIKLDFYPKPEEALAKFREKKKRLDAMLEARRGPRLPPRID
ncbi:inactive protein RESTRICTED TEV MOVEMENT 2-like [Cannabis sativa]|uniref:inactive protein RESTRICTED TEV MOVEMENT 2-like n=1 Tax=Cannabis sativa TaxID=3483 RepID=UPI0029CA2BD2|nr:inactive protein RESTRICTED TEV MOVEMENT 2-like [Cannabis sativa]